MEFQKFELGTKLQMVQGIRRKKDALPTVFVGINAGVYKVQFDSSKNKVEFRKDKDILQNCEVLYVSTEIYENDLTPKHGTEGVLYFPCCELFFRENGKRYKLIMEYLDTSFCKILTHGHPDNVTEVYLSVEEPYKGEVCDFCDVHQPFVNHTLAVKLIKL